MKLNAFRVCTVCGKTVTAAQLAEHLAEHIRQVNGR